MNGPKSSTPDPFFSISFILLTKINKVEKETMQLYTKEKKIHFTSRDNTKIRELKLIFINIKLFIVEHWKILRKNVN